MFIINIFFIFVLPLVACCAAAMDASLRRQGDDKDANAEDPHASLRANVPILYGASRKLQGNNTAPDGSCHISVTTDYTAEVPIAGKGILFSIQSNDMDEDGLTITSFGFYLDRSVVLTEPGYVEYEVYVLNEEGYYASPERDASNPSDISLTAVDPYDYRGNMTVFTLIASGQIYDIDLTPGVNENDGFFQTQYGAFDDFNTSVPARGGIRSFYLATKSSAFLASDLTTDTTMLNTEILLVNEAIDDDYPPKLLVGEGAVSYPMGLQTWSYFTKAFWGSVFYEAVCPTSSPSVSSNPSSSPTVAPSESPSFSPTFITSAPSLVPSELPSSAPTSPPSMTPKTTEGGVSLQFNMECTPGANFEAQNAAVENTVTATVAAKETPGLSNAKATVVAAVCGPAKQRRHLMLNPGDIAVNSNRHRQLQPGSSALDFSVVITGEYAAPSGQSESEFNLGSIAEDSINSDPEAFVKDLKARAGANSPFAAVEADDMAVKEVDPELLTAAPTRMPTLLPTMKEDDKTDLLIGIIIVSGLIVVLGSFLLYRHGEERAAKKRSKEMDRVQAKKEKARLDKLQKEEEEYEAQVGYHPNIYHSSKEKKSKQELF